MLEGRRYPPYWVPCLGKSAHSSCLLSRCSDGRIETLKAGATRPKRLALQPGGDFRAYVDGDGHLHIIELMMTRIVPSVMCWHVIDLATGKILFADQRHLYLWKAHQLDQQDLDLVHHAASYVFTMLGDYTIVIVDAASRGDVSHWNVIPQHRGTCGGTTRLGNFKSSPHGDMLAVTMHLVLIEGNATYNEAKTAAAAEVHIYRCKSGECLQSYQLGGLTADRYHLRWSSQLNLLAVFSRHQNHSQHAGPVLGLLHILDPARQKVTTEGESAEWCSQNLWDCQWTPDGDLLVASARPNDHNYSWQLVMDPHNMATLFTAREANDPRHPGISWAVKPASGLQDRTLTAYLRGQCTLISFTFTHGEWRAARLVEDEPAGCFGGCILPSGEAVAAFQGQADSSLSLSHWDLRTGQMHTIAPGHAAADLAKPWQPACTWVQPEFAPFPRAWPPVYAYIHRASRKVLQVAACEVSVNLVDAASHRPLRIWTCQDLLDLRGRKPSTRALVQPPHAECWQICGLRWASNGRYLAVYDKYGCTQVLGFGVE